jgi:hypothetical protein
MPLLLLLLLLLLQAAHRAHRAGRGGAGRGGRLTTRTFYIADPRRSLLNPLSWPFRLVGFWYWHMNFHIEHHMYAMVCASRAGLSLAAY